MYRFTSPYGTDSEESSDDRQPLGIVAQMQKQYSDGRRATSIRDDRQAPSGSGGGGGAGGPNGLQSNQWQCPTCTFHNAIEVTSCEMCSAAQPSGAARPSLQEAALQRQREFEAQISAQRLRQQEEEEMRLLERERERIRAEFESSSSDSEEPQGRQPSVRFEEPQPAEPPVQQDSDDEGEIWRCGSCTFENDADAEQCGVCRAGKSGGAPAEELIRAQLKQDSHLEEEETQIQPQETEVLGVQSPIHRELTDLSTDEDFPNVEAQPTPRKKKASERALRRLKSITAKADYVTDEMLSKVFRAYFGRVGRKSEELLLQALRRLLREEGDAEDPGTVMQVLLQFPQLEDFEKEVICDDHHAKWATELAYCYFREGEDRRAEAVAKSWLFQHHFGEEFAQALCAKGETNILPLWRLLYTKYPQYGEVLNQAAQQSSKTRLVAAIRALEKNKESVTSHEARQMGERWFDEKARAKVFLHELRVVCEETKTKEETVMAPVVEAMARLVQKEAFVDPFLLSLCFLYDEERMLSVSKEKWTEILNIDNVSKWPIRWNWVKRTFMNGPLLCMRPGEGKKFTATPQGEKKTPAGNDTKGAEKTDTNKEPLAAETSAPQPPKEKEEAKAPEQGEHSHEHAHSHGHGHDHDHSHAHGGEHSHGHEGHEGHEGHNHAHAHAHGDHEHGKDGPKESKHARSRSSMKKPKKKKEKMLFDEICAIARQQNNSKKEWLSGAIKQLADAEDEAYQTLKDFEFKHPEFPDKTTWRQDRIPNGVMADMSEQALQGIMIHSDVTNYNPLKEYDFGEYLAKVIRRGHVMQPHFKVIVRNRVKGRGMVRFGPVKTVERTRIKAENGHWRDPFPTSAQVIDILRCSVTFESVGALVEVLQEWISLYRDRDLSPDFEIVRVGNGFHRSRCCVYPSHYADVKVNAIVTILDPTTNKKISLLSETQFLLRPMLEFKKLQHELYEVIRLRRFFEKILERSQISLVKEIDESGGNHHQLANIFDKYQFMFNPQLLLSEYDMYGVKRPLIMSLMKSDLTEDVNFVFDRICREYDMKDVWEARDKDGKCCLHVALQAGNASIIEWMGANVPVFRDWLQKEESTTPLFMIGCRCLRGDALKVFPLLIPRDADDEWWIRHCYEGSAMPLMHACVWNQDPTVIDALMPNIPEGLRQRVLMTQDEDGKSAWDLAMEQGNKVAADLLVKWSKRSMS